MVTTFSKDPNLKRFSRLDWLRVHSWCLSYSMRGRKRLGIGCLVICWTDLCYCCLILHETIMFLVFWQNCQYVLWNLLPGTDMIDPLRSLTALFLIFLTQKTLLCLYCMPGTVHIELDNQYGIEKVSNGESILYPKSNAEPLDGFQQGDGITTTAF